MIFFARAGFHMALLAAIWPTLAELPTVSLLGIIALGVIAAVPSGAVESKPSRYP